MPASLQGKVALITGAGGSIGSHLAMALADAGAVLVLTDSEPERAQRVAQHIAAGGAQAHALPLDVCNEEQWSRATQAAVDRCGGLDIVINNAGVEFFSVLRDVDAERARRLLDVNVVGVLLGIKHGLRCMAPGGASGRGGTIVNIASAAALGSPFGMGLYAASKAAVDRLTKVAAVESGLLRCGVRVNCVMPGAVTDSAMFSHLLDEMLEAGVFPNAEAAQARFAQQTPAGRCAALDEVARAVLYLASDQSAFVNGVSVPVDGGNHLA